MLTERRQQQLIAELIHGRLPLVEMGLLQDPYDYLWELVIALEPQQAYQELLRLKLNEPELAEVIEAILAMAPGAMPSHRSLAEIGPNLPQTTWFWPNWIPRGLLTLLAAWPGVGKTYLALDLARRLIESLPAPDEALFQRRSGTVVYVDAEDFLPDIYERATVWQMPLDRFYPIQRPPRDLIDLARKDDQDQLIEMCYDLRPDLVIVDSLSSVNVKGENNIEDVREVLGFLMEVAGAFDLALILIHHLRKPNQGVTQPITMHDLRGTGHLVAMARSILSLDVIKTGPTEDFNGPRQLKVLKKNRGKYPPPLGLRYEDSATNPDVAVLVFGPIELFAHYPETLAEKCATWLRDLLEERGPLPFKEIQALAAIEDFRRGVLTEARQLLGDQVVDTRGTKRWGNKWALAGQVDEAQEGDGPPRPVAAQGSELVERCAAWLVATLQAGPLRYGELKKLAAEQGFKENTLQKARQQCPEIGDTLGPRRRGNRWQLPDPTHSS